MAQHPAIGYTQKGTSIYLFIRSRKENAAMPEAKNPQEQSAWDEWNSTAPLFPDGKAPDYNTGIADSWRHHVFANRNPGPPLSHEYSTVNWNGVKW
jgi:hypothetical protein